MKQEHNLNEVVRFQRPERNGGEVYFLWYCSCGTVGGKRSTDQIARDDHARHVKDNS